MNMPYFFAFLPILISLASLLVSFIHGSNKNKTGIIDNLSKELSSKRVTPYVVQVCVSRIHNSRPIQFSILKKLLNYNDALEIIQLFSYGRKVLDIFKFTEDGNRILVGYSEAYNTFTSRLMSMLVCLLSLLVCYSASVYFMIEIMFSLNQMNSMGSVGVEAGDVIFKSIGLIFFMLMTFGFSWQFVVIFGSGKRIKKIQKLIDENYSRKNYSRNR